MQMSGFLWTHPGTVIGYATQTAAVGNAALRGHISKALAISVCAPTAMELQHCNLHLPFRCAVVVASACRVQVFVFLRCADACVVAFCLSAKLRCVRAKRVWLPVVHLVAAA